MIQIIDMSKEYYNEKAFIHYKSWIETYSLLMNKDFLKLMSLEKCEKIANKYPENTIIAIKNDKVVGFTAYNKSNDLPKIGEIYALYVLKEYQKQGIGKLLLNECIKRLNDFDQIILYVLYNNEKSISWYKNQGFIMDEFIKYEKTPIDGYQLKEFRMVYSKKK